jgi:hypothetical protein
MELNWKNGDSTPDHMSEIHYYVDGENEQCCGAFALIWSMIDEAGIPYGDEIPYDGTDDSPGAEYGLIGLIDGYTMNSDIIWVSSDEHMAWLESKFKGE